MYYLWRADINFTCLVFLLWVILCCRTANSVLGLFWQQLASLSCILTVQHSVLYIIIYEHVRKWSEWVVLSAAITWPVCLDIRLLSALFRQLYHHTVCEVLYWYIDIFECWTAFVWHLVKWPNLTTVCCIHCIVSCAWCWMDELTGVRVCVCASNHGVQKEAWFVLCTVFNYRSEMLLSII